MNSKSDHEGEKEKKLTNTNRFGDCLENYELSNETENKAHVYPKKIPNRKNGILKNTDANHGTVENPYHEDVDLADILGTNWPKRAGAAAMILNNKSKTVTESIGCEDAIKKPASPILVKPEPEEPLRFTIADYQPLIEIPGTELAIGSLVEVSNTGVCEDLYGVIRWIGIPPGSPRNVLVGIEVEDESNLKNVVTSDGRHNGVRLFTCHDGRAIFVPANRCTADRRFADVDNSISANRVSNNHAKKFGVADCPAIYGSIPPLEIHNSEELAGICGKFKGIQGHHNSCYLDATLFSMFTFTSVFDSILYRHPGPQDIRNYSEVQKVLRDEIVNPLRKNVFVRSDRVMKLRELLDQLSSVSGLTCEEKDPEEFLNSLLSQIMRVEPFLKLSSGQDSYFYQLFVEKDEKLTLPSVQQLFEQSFHSSDIKLKEVPSCFIIQMPRFGKNYKMYPRILPSQVLDVTDIIENSPRQCSLCGKLAEYECRDCFGSLQAGSGLECTAFCPKCLKTFHSHIKRTNHVSKKIFSPKEFRIMAEHMVVPRLYMELFAVVCIETSHYVAFVKSGSGPDAPWCFFDSMADRKGEQNGYNIPEITCVPELTQWLSEEGARSINETSTNDKVLPEHAKRIFCDAYMCLYQSTDIMMYH
ncbi:ubiquitin carboxyl-terminal hydrolase CYLD isoform X1 [Drosophila eugracilis]|uniref:ubiquitin carboxyl-terminal hydrolase CYLD isoform X1 n=1 Tax=Drosophila eugracilis TaxID=29029 RepID=UPI0007E8076B|nr:ubiquitin carboxyl-terminal hydrolase CYLD isoform X1 [Drosophila eugracilis]XP_017076069.1 ubiquitin carboxyl-terminal hydrolase CYLD isoform X1 [Drosophila eugracilis]XP_017076070.1 ubiquitin carboxyl-terminal hydrolase CYLD isoform X1 [Drosophila eugracilis]XP_017076071.1 ubiquitin carboxyl-terminal hydrolase CYLD isoform X1 [Drosophila eugracilis]